ncbi:unnamed protein product, partial [marine sediment metagenome]
MRNRNLLTTFMGVALALSLASQALAQAPIDGWDKAKFGMSPGEVETAYDEEMSEKYSEDGAYFFTSLPLKSLKGFMGSVTFCFVDNKLFEIRLLFVKSGKLIREVRRFWLTLLQVENFLKKKYGVPVEQERIGGRKILEWVDSEGNGLSLMVNFGHDIEFHFFEVTYFHKE